MLRTPCGYQNWIGGRQACIVLSNTDNKLQTQSGGLGWQRSCGEFIFLSWLFCCSMCFIHLTGDRFLWIWEVFFCDFIEIISYDLEAVFFSMFVVSQTLPCSTHTFFKVWVIQFLCLILQLWYSVGEAFYWASFLTLLISPWPSKIETLALNPTSPMEGTDISIILRHSSPLNIANTSTKEKRGIEFLKNK